MSSTYSDTYRPVRAAFETLSDNAVAYTFYDGASDQSKQFTQVETATQGSNLLIVNIVTGSDEAAQNIVDAAKAKDIPVIFFNREASDAAVNSYEKCCSRARRGRGRLYAGPMIYDSRSTEGWPGIPQRRRQDHYLMFRGELGNAEALGRAYWCRTPTRSSAGCCALSRQPDRQHPARRGISP